MIPSSRLVFLEGLNLASAPNIAYVMWDKLVVDNNTPAPPPQPNDLAAIIEGLSSQLSEVTDVWFVALPPMMVVNLHDTPDGLGHFPTPSWASPPPRRDHQQARHGSR